MNGGYMLLYVAKEFCTLLRCNKYCVLDIFLV